MKLYSTQNKNRLVDFKTAVFHSLPPDNGLYMPKEIPCLSPNFFNQLEDKNGGEIAFQVSKAMLGQAIPETDLKNIIEEAINFPAPLKEVESDIYVLELFHGPSMAFKDFGARFMSRVMHYFLEKSSRELDILVATSGDTGGAVAMGFYEVPGIRVTILYPKGKVSPLQEKQLTTLGKNITALEVEGTFDDCQRLVKEAFLDQDLNQCKNLSSANSINIARLIPQMFYYFNAVAQLRKNGDQRAPIFSVPSGNFGNLTAGLFAAKMGLPVAHFVAATNVNDEVPQYLKTGNFVSRPSTPTLANAMDVGNPSNFVRMQDLYHHKVEEMKKDISGFSFTDAQLLEAITKVSAASNYMLCPHTAIAYLGLQAYRASVPHNSPGIFLSSAHPCKFSNVYSPELWEKVVLPPQAKSLEEREKQAVAMSTDFNQFKEWLLQV